MDNINSQTPINFSPTHIPSLDGWRAVAILIVLTSHLGWGHIIPGGLGVTIFFFLSGYLITTLLIQEHHRNGSISIKHFYIRRALRLMPPLIITLIVIYLLVILGFAKGGISFAGISSQLLYFANYYYLFFDTGNTTPAGTGIFWSLAVEEHFYLFFPFLFITFFSIEKKKTLPILLMVACIAALIWRYILVVAMDSSTSRTYYATDTRIDSIIFGCLLALSKNPMHQSKPQRFLARKDYLVIAIATMALLATLLIRNNLFRETLRYTVQGIALAPLFYYSIRFSKHRFFALLNTAAMEKIGQHSYTIYLIHYFIIENLAAHFSKIWMIPLTIGLIAVYAKIIEKYVDTPCMQLRKKYR